MSKYVEEGCQEEVNAERVVDQGTEETISYEEAFKKEKEYQNMMKLKLLQPSCSTSWTFVSPSEEQPPEPNALSGTKRELPTSSQGLNDQHLPQKKLRLSECHLQASALSTLQHRKTSIPQLTNKQPSRLQWCCNICNIPCMSAFNLEQHLQGKKHKAMLDIGGKNKTCSEWNKHLWCSLCNIPCMNEMSMEQHRRGKKHAARLVSLVDLEQLLKKDSGQ